MEDRIILHSDFNSFYASVELCYRPWLKDLAIAIAGNPEQRHGIILTANRNAKKYGVKVGMAIWQALQVCPNLVCLPPNYDLYMKFSGKGRKLYGQYTDKVEAFGLDENWLDISSPKLTFADGTKIADEIRQRIREELGITASIGVSYNKVFAKLGSDMRKPDYTNVISRENYRDVVWPLPASDLLYVGTQTTKKLAEVNVLTIGDLAQHPTELLQSRLGVNGVYLKGYALGLDTSPVTNEGFSRDPKSVGNSSTPPHDVSNMDHARGLMYLLAESVAARLRAGGFRTSCISISARNPSLITHSRQKTLKRPTNITSEIAEQAMSLFDFSFARDLPYRSMGLSCDKLSGIGANYQTSMFGDEGQRTKLEALDSALDGLRYRYGHQIIQRGVVLLDEAYARINPVEEHTIHPVAFYAG